MSITMGSRDLMDLMDYMEKKYRTMPRVQFSEPEINLFQADSERPLDTIEKTDKPSEPRPLQVNIHWSKTPEGRKKLSKLAKARWRKTNKGAGK